MDMLIELKEKKKCCRKKTFRKGVGWFEMKEPRRKWSQNRKRDSRMPDHPKDMLEDPKTWKDRQ